MPSRKNDYVGNFIRNLQQSEAQRAGATAASSVDDEMQPAVVGKCFYWTQTTSTLDMAVICHALQGNSQYEAI